MRLKELRKAIHKSQQVVADAVGVSQRSYAYYETGIRVVDYDTLIKLADYFNVSIDYLLGRQSPNVSPERQELLDKVQTLSEEQVKLLLNVVSQLK